MALFKKIFNIFKKRHTSSKAKPKPPKLKKVRKLPKPKKSGKPKKLKKPEKQKSLGAPLGEVTHYFSRISVCVIKITHGPLFLADKIRIKGHTTDFVQAVRSLQI